MPLYQLNSRNLLFIHVPKTGGKSVEEFLKGLSGGQALFHPKKQDIFPCSPQHMHAEALAMLFGNRFLDHSFMVVRNPYRRFVSEYHWRVTRKNGEEPFEAWAHNILDALEANPYVLDNHLRPQVEFRMSGTDVHKLEDGLEKAVEAAVRAIGLDVERPSLRQTHQVAKAEVTAGRTLVDRLRETYAADFDAFGYNPQDLANAFHVA
jgi:hypothetical protein